MTATEELRRILDERGVEWMPVAWNPKRETFYHAANGVGICADEYGDELKFYTDTSVTPAKAVEATLGRGECEIETTENWLPAKRYHRCKYCGAFFAVMDASSDIQPCVCPNCGRKVVDE